MCTHEYDLLSPFFSLRRNEAAKVRRSENNEFCGPEGPERIKASGYIAGVLTS